MNGLGVAVGGPAAATDLDRAVVVAEVDEESGEGGHPFWTGAGRREGAVEWWGLEGRRGRRG